MVLPVPCGGDLLVVYRRAGERDGIALFTWSRLSRARVRPAGEDRGRSARERAAQARERAVMAAARAATLHGVAAEVQARQAERLLGTGDLDGAERAVERACAARVRERWARSLALNGVSRADTA